MMHNCLAMDMMHNRLAMERRTTWLASLGSALEYYDFVVYGMMANYLKTIFFPPDNDSIALLQFFSVFAMGYLARPFGGILAGVLGDKFGRRPIFLFLTILMATSTLLIGFLPSYSEAGITATLLLILCRLLQGLSFGGELPGATTIVAEFAPLKRRSFRASFVIASVSVGALSASFALLLITSFSKESDILAWGWRVPFIVGGFLGLILFWARKNLMETPVFQSLNLSKNPNTPNKPLKQIVLQHKISVLIGAALTVFLAGMVIVNLYFPYYIKQYYSFSEKNIYLATTLSLIFSSLVLPLTGRLADRMAKESLLKWATLLYFVFSYSLFQLLSYPYLTCLILFMMIHQLFIALFSSCYFPLMVNLFPPIVRYTGIALCYNLVYVLIGNLPTGLTALLKIFQTPLVVPVVMAGTAAVSFLGISIHQRIIKDTNDEAFVAETLI